MWPDHETKVDLLGVKHLVESVTAIVACDELLPATIGIFGDWGSGKSSLIQMVEEELNGDENVLVISFNGWLFEGYDDAKTALMETIIDEIAQRKTLGNQAKVLALNLLRKVNWFRVAGAAVKYSAAAIAGGPVGVAALAGIDASKVASKAGEIMSDLDPAEVGELFEDERKQTLRKGVREFRATFAEFLNEATVSKLVVVVDDLDRCLPDTIIETLEAIKLFLYVPKTAFILGADERLVKYAVRSRFPELPGDKTDVGRDYLEKLIQYMVRIPAMSKTDTENYIALLFSQPHVKSEDMERICEWALAPESIAECRTFGLSSASELLGEMPEELKEDLALAERISPLLAEGMNGNPRQCKRFLNTLLMRLKMAECRKIDLQQRVLAKLMILEYLRPETFRKVANWQVTQSGKPIQLVVAERMQRGEGLQGEETPTPVKPIAKGSSTDSDIKSDCDALCEDSLVCEWLQLEPSLTDIDLRPYYYFSRDHLGALSSAAKRLSAVAREVIHKLLSSSDAVREQGLKKGNDISPVDAASIFEELVNRARLLEQHNEKNSPFMLLLDWAGVRPELLGELFNYLASFPAQQQPPESIIKLHSICKRLDRLDLCVAYFERLSASDTNSRVSKLAQKRLENIMKKKRGDR